MKEIRDTVKVKFCMNDTDKTQTKMHNTTDVKVLKEGGVFSRLIFTIDDVKDARLIVYEQSGEVFFTMRNICKSYQYATFNPEFGKELFCALIEIYK